MATMTKRPEDFAAVSLAEAKTLMPDLPEATINKPFVEGDHFQNGDAWVGPGPKSGDPRYSAFLAALDPAEAGGVFISKNVMSEIQQRLVSAVVGRAPRWLFVPRRLVTKETPMTPEEETRLNELNQFVTEWWDVRETSRVMKTLLGNALYATEDTLRFYVASSRLGADGAVSAKTFEEALGLIFVEAPDPETITVWEDPVTRERLGIYLFRNESNVECAELTWLTLDRQTAVMVVPTETTPHVNDFAGNLTMFRVGLDRPLLTEQIRSLQKALNMTLTLLSKGLVDNHFTEKFFKNALPPGKWTYTEGPSGQKVQDKYEVEVRSTGSRIDTWMQGIDYKDEKGVTQLKDPDVVWRDPQDPNNTINGVDYWYRAMLEEARQDHILMNQDATPSGKSRAEAREDFADSGKDAELQMNLAGRALLMTVVAMAEAFWGKPGHYTKEFKPTFTVVAKYGSLTVEERAQNVAEAKEGLLSDDTAMARNNVEDTDAERSAITTSDRGALGLAKARMEVATVAGADFPRDVALFIAGFKDDEIKEIMKRTKASESTDPDEPEPEPVPTSGGPKPAAKKPAP